MTARTTLLLSVCLTACMTSRPPQKVTGANSVQGVVGALVLRDSRDHSGELLAVDDSAFVLLVRNRVGIARFRDMRSARFTLPGASPLVLGLGPKPAELARARMVSRFPYGITATAMATLLAASKQEVVEDLAQTAP